MAGNSHKHTRLVNYKKKRPSANRGFRLWYIIPIAALLAFTLAIIIGNILGDSVSYPTSSESTPPTSDTPSAKPHGPVRVTAHHVTLKGIYDNTAASVRAQIPEGAKAVSMTLFNAQGEPYYLSEVAAAFGNKCGELTLKNVFKPTAEDSIYTSVLFPSTLLSDPEPLKKAVISAYEATLAAELWQAGADEIMIHFNAIGSDSKVIGDNFSELITDYITALRAQSDGLRIAVVITPEDLSYDKAVVVEKLCSIADLCAVDLTSVDDGNELTATLLELSASILRHDMRLILTHEGKTDELIATAEDVTKKLGISNVQYVG